MANSMRFVLLVAVLMIVATPAIGQTSKLLVTLGPYEIQFEDSATAQKAHAVAEAVLNAAGTTNGIEAVLIDELCETEECISELSKVHGAERAVFVSVTENMGHYDFSLHFLDTTIEGKWTGSFSEVVEKIKMLTLDALAASTEQNEEEPSVKDDAAEKTVAEEAKPDPDANLPDAGRRSIKNKGLFFGAVSVTAAVAVGFIVTESLAQSSWKKLESDDWDSQTRWEEERDRHHVLQLTSRVLLIGTVVFGTTSLILGLKTDFRGENHVALTPTRGGGYLSLSGRF